MSHPKCLICFIKFEAWSTPSSQNESQSQKKVFDTFCSYLELPFQRENWNFENEILPFCPTCHERVLNLYFMEEEFRSIKFKISNLIANIAKTVLESAATFKNNTNKGEEVPEKNQNKFSSKSTTLGTDSIGKILECRSVIVKNYTPTLTLRKRQISPSNFSIKRRLRNSKYFTLKSNQDETKSPITSDDDFQVLTPTSDSNDSDSFLDHWEENGQLQTPSKDHTDGPVTPNVKSLNLNESNNSELDQNIYVEFESSNELELQQTTKVPTQSQPRPGRRTVALKQTQRIKADSIITIDIIESDNGQDNLNQPTVEEQSQSILSNSVSREDSSQNCDVIFVTVPPQPRQDKPLQTSKQMFICPACDDNQEQIDGFIQHIQTTHPEIKVMNEIVDCGHGHVISDGLHLFWKSESTNGFVCRTCRTTIPSRNDIKNHVKTHPKTLCVTCGRVLHSVASLAAHRLKNHPIESNVPNLWYKNQGKIYVVGSDEIYYEKYSTDETTQGQEEQYKCNKCGFICAEQNVRVLIQHVKQHLEPKSSKKNEDKMTKETHIRIKDTLKTGPTQFLYKGKWAYTLENGQYKCSTCDTICNTCTLMSNHLRRSHEKPLRTICYKCGKSFRAGQNFTAHLAIHTDIKAFQCSECGRTFKTKKSLFVHQKNVCGKEKPRKRPQRSKSIRSQSQSLGDTSTPFSCQDCGKNFKLQSELDHHLTLCQDTEERVQSVDSVDPDEVGGQPSVKGIKRKIQSQEMDESNSSIEYDDGTTEEESQVSYRIKFN